MTVEVTAAAIGHGEAGVPARRLAWESVSEVLRARAALDETFEARSGRAQLPARDEALARAIATVTFRRFGTLVQALEARLAKGLPNDERLFALLATGAAQILFLDVPDHAAVDIAVRLATAERRPKQQAGLVNAVLRRIARESAAIIAGAHPLRADTPPWLAERWTRHYGAAGAEAIAVAHRGGAALDLTIKSDAPAWAERLKGSLLPTGSVRLTARTPVRELPGYDEGAWWVQDAAASLPARLVEARPGQRIADLCAAPGGKTAQLAAAGAKVVAIDRSKRRLARVRENLERLRLTAEIRAADVLELDEAGAYDAVLLDAPCTATGTIRRHPDVAWTKRAADVAALAGMQERLLDKAAALVRPGGRLVYCTCSLEPEEGEHQIEAFLARQPGYRRLPVDPREVGGFAELVDAHGSLRTLPSSLPEAAPGGLDGFFAARLQRTEN